MSEESLGSKNKFRGALIPLIFALSALNLAVHAQSETTAPTTSKIVENIGSEHTQVREFNFRVSPIGILFGVAGLSADFAAFPHIALGLSIDWFVASSVNPTAHLYEVGITSTLTPWNLCLEDGFYARPFAYWIRRDTRRTTASTSNFSLGSYFGYQWYFKYGFNLAMGMGITYSNYAPAVGLNPALESTAGWSF